MTDLKFYANNEQAGEIEGLIHWSDDLSYCLERYATDADAINQARRSIEYCFDCLDRLKVPFWVQNTAYFYGSDWRLNSTTYTWDYLSKKGIFKA